MNQQDVLDRLREELNIPFFDGKSKIKSIAKRNIRNSKPIYRTTLNNMYRM